MEAIQKLRIRGAPAIGICAAYCMYVLARSVEEAAPAAFQTRLRAHAALLKDARPTAVNLSWAVGEMLKTAEAHAAAPRSVLLDSLYH